MQIIARGAEAVLKKEGDRVIKERTRKGYRLPQLDVRLRKQRTQQELRLMNEARRAGVNVPMAREINESTLEIEFVEGKMVKNILSEKNADEIGADIGKEIAKLHANGIIHGDLTTSNMILEDDIIFLIDFGLGFFSQRIEDKAVDLYLLKEVITSTHNSIEKKPWSAVINAYKSSFDESDKIIKTLHQIEKRGRYRKRD
ncbi:MAG: Kae1-associated serine/threonine protein kinase [Candidatus Aenigmarchaeota archaeon]|nr:Kae1-associated serine/threonine protein kinase [Candidatus Aenigmarchaeota archaeon]